MLMKILFSSFLIILFSSFSIGQQSLDIDLKKLEDFVDNKKFSNSDTLYVLSKIDSIQSNYTLEDCENWYEFVRIKALILYTISGLNENAGNYEMLENRSIEFNKSVVDRIIVCFGKDHEYLARTYFNIGAAYYYLINDKQTEIYYNKVLEVDHNNKNPSDKVCQRLIFMGEFFSNILNDYDRGLEFFEVALNKLPKKDPLKSKYMILRSQARALYDKESIQESIDKYSEAIILAEKIYPQKSIIETSFDFEEIAICYLKRGEFILAEKNIRKALSISTKHFPQKQKEIDLQRIKLTEILEAQNRRAEADKFYDEIIDDYSQNLSRYNLDRLSWVAQLKGENLHDMREFQKALQTYHFGYTYITDKAPLDYLQNPQIKNNSFLSESSYLDLLGSKINTLNSLSDQSSEQKYLNATVDAVEKYDSLISLTLLKDWKEGSHQVLLNKSKSIYDDGMKASLTQHQVTDNEEDLESAYRFSSKFKSRLLTKGINLKEKEGQLLDDQQKVVIDSLRDTIQDLRNEIQIASLQKDTTKQRKLYEEVFSQEEELKAFKQRNGISNVLTEKDVSYIPSVSEIQAKLDENQAIIEYHLSDSILYSFYISKKSFSHHASDIKPESIIDYYGALTSGKNISDYNLDSQLVGILKEKDLSNISNFIIIPDGELTQFPFEALKYDGAQLIEKYNISYEYSSAFLFDDRDYTIDRSLAAFASDYSSSTFDLLHQNTNYGEEGIHLAELKYTLDEVDIANKLLNGLIFKNDKATKANFEANCNNNKILHLALHGVINNEIPDQSALVFDSKDNDHLLTASEIYNMDMNNNLTILSACNTGVGPVRVGDGVRSMARSFIHAGSQSVITSLWEISDVTTKKILESFYSYLNDGKSKAEALRLAKLDFINSASPTQQHPKYWAHLVLVGDPGPIASSAQLNWKMYGLIGLGLLGLLLVFKMISGPKSSND